VSDIGQLAFSTSGLFFYYPYFSKEIDRTHLEDNLRTSLCKNIGYESFTRLRLSKDFCIQEVIGNCAVATEHAVVQPLSSSEKSYMFSIVYKLPAPKVAVVGDMMPVIYHENEEPAPKSLILQVW
jgi:hypothetical protein